VKANKKSTEQLQSHENEKKLVRVVGVNENHEVGKVFQKGVSVNAHGESTNCLSGQPCQ